MQKKYMFAILTLLLMSAVLGGCEWFEEQIQAANCEYRIISEDIAYSDVTFIPSLSLTLTVPIEARNPNNDTDAYLKRMTFKLYVNDTFVLQGEMTESVTIPAGESVTFNVPVTLDEKLTTELYDAIQDGSADYKITGTVYLDIAGEEHSFEVTIVEDTWSS